MKNRVFSLVITLLLITANAGFCAQTTRSVAVQNLIVKFTIAMLGVILASIVIWLGLAIYNKIVYNKTNNNFEEEVLKTPKTVDEAVKFFIRKNRLK